MNNFFTVVAALACIHAGFTHPNRLARGVIIGCGAILLLQIIFPR